MHQTISILTIATLALSISACSAKKESTEPAGITYKSRELIVRQCQDISNLEQAKLFEKHELTVRKQVSPHLYIVTWDDEDRNVDAVQHELKSTQMFCGVDKYQQQ